MKSRITVIALCVDDVDHAVEFYRDSPSLPA